MRGKILFAAALAAIAGASFATPRPALAHGQTVTMGGSYMAGTIVVRTRERHLYYVLGGGQAIRYPVGVGRAGKQWSGNSRIDGKYLQPAWSPPADVKRDKPRIPNLIAGGSALHEDLPFSLPVGGLLLLAAVVMLAIAGARQLIKPSSAATHSPLARWVLPVPQSPMKTTGSTCSRYFPSASSRI
jgi:hypothetical protein